MPDHRSEAVIDAWADFSQGTDEFIAPPLLYPETISVIRRLAHSGHLSGNEAREIVQDFLALDITTPVPSGLYQQAYELAERYQHPRAYDACYLAQANLLSCDLLTLDRRLYNAAVKDFPQIRLIGV